MNLAAPFMSIFIDQFFDADAQEFGKSFSVLVGQDDTAFSLAAVAAHPAFEGCHGHGRIPIA